MELINGVHNISDTRLPPVVIEFIVQDDVRIAVSRQAWTHPEHGDIPIELYLPVADGIEVLLADVTARKYTIKFMNMKAKRMIAAGFKPKFRTELEAAEAAFATPIGKNGAVQ